MKQNLKLFSYVLVLVGVLGLVGFYSARKWILHKVIENAQQNIKTKYNFNLWVEGASWEGFSGINIHRMHVVPINKDTLLSIESIHLKPRLISFLSGKKSFSDIKIYHGNIQLIKDSLGSNYQNILNPKRQKQKNLKTKKTYQENIENLIDGISELIPEVVQMKNITTIIKYNGIKETLKINYLEKRRNTITSVLEVKNSSIKINGELNADLNKFNLNISGSNAIELPFIFNVFELKSGFKEFYLEITRRENNHNLNFIGIARAQQLYANHSKLSDDTITLNNLSILFDLTFKDDYIELDSSSFLKINNNTAKLFFTFDKQNHKTISFGLFMPKTPANIFFNSLPKGLFNHVNDIKADGFLSYNLNFTIPIDLPDSIKINSELKSYDFKILNYGKTNLSKINSEFEYTAYEKGVPVKTFKVGPSNKDFVPLGAVSPYIQKAILTSEDGGFFWHKGFNEEAIARSIAVNIKERKFKRGGSTISMQLVKNVFLTRNKTLSRKLEEMLITWLIENQRIVSKQRMFEVYLNVIEFGPLIYGIGPACLFYFGKKPSDVTLNEAIFLSSLLPHPKWFKYSFDKNGELKPYLQDYFKFMGKVMFSKNLISENEFNDLKPQVDLYRDAKKLLDTDTPINTDSLDLNYNE